MAHRAHASKVFLLLRPAREVDEVENGERLSGRACRDAEVVESRIPATARSLGDVQDHAVRSSGSLVLQV